MLHVTLSHVWYATTLNTIIPDMLSCHHCLKRLHEGWNQPIMQQYVTMQHLYIQLVQP